MTWQDACDAGVDKSGGKGFNLGRLACYGYTISLARLDLSERPFITINTAFS